MKDNREIRAAAWKVVRGPWLWRLVTVGLALKLVAQLASSLLQYMLRQSGIQTWSDFYIAKFKAIQSGLELSVPSSHLSWQMTGASGCEYFIICIFASIFAYGFAIAALKSVGNEEERWFAASFSGFRRPLELAWLMFLMNLRVMLWSLLLVIPGIVAAYRYRQAWYLKSEHPDWSAGECLAKSGKLMQGHKRQALALDVSYLGWFLLAAMLMGLGAVLTATRVPAIAILGSVTGVAGIAALMFVLCYLVVGRAVFYRELGQE